MNERMKILEMLKDGKITPEQADKLLDRLAKLDAEPDEDDFVVEEPRAYKAAAIAMALKAKKKTKGKRFLGIHVTTHDGKNINVRLPLGIVKAGVKMTALLPESARDAPEAKGLSLAELVKLHGDDLTQALDEPDIRISTDAGDNINIGPER